MKLYWLTLKVQQANVIAESIVKDQDLKLEVYGNIQKYAGSFVKHLGEAMLVADPINLYVLIMAFMPYFIDYLPKSKQND